MKTEYIKKHNVNYTEVNSKGQLDIVSSFNLVQNMMTEYFESFKSDNIRLKKNNNAIWVVTKTKIHYNNYPNWKEQIYGKGDTTKVKPIRIEIETNFKNADNEILFVAKQECCVIDLDTRRIRKVDTVDYPSDMETSEEILKQPYEAFKSEFTDEDYVYTQKVFSSDIDYSNHTNNVSYVKFLMNTLPCKFFNENKISDFEIHYLNESKESEELRIYKKELSDSMEFLIKENEKEIVRAKMYYTMVE